MSLRIIWLDQSQQINHAVWSGSISLNRSDFKHADEYSEHIVKSYSETKKGAAIRCIDGRPAEAKNGPLGPQTAGGSPGIALASLVAHDKKHHVVHALRELIDAAPGRFKHGAHTDTHASTPFCGCGAIDKMADIINKIKKYPDEIKPIVQIIMDADFDDPAYERIIESFKKLDTEHLLPEGYRHELIKLTSHHETAIEKVVGHHNEVAIVANKSPHTTLDKDPLSHSTGHEVQAFGFDYWFAKEFAAGQIDLLTALVIYQIAAAMVLTDGTLAVGIRQMA